MNHTDIKKILKLCFRRGFKVKQGKKAHYKVYLPNGKIIVISSSPSDERALMAIFADFKRAGFPLLKHDI